MRIFKLQVDARLVYAKFNKVAAQNASQLLRELDTSLSPTERRELKKISTIGTDALKNETKLKQVQHLYSFFGNTSNMKIKIQDMVGGLEKLRPYL